MPTESHMEGRVARLEEGLTQLTRNVSDLTTSLREYSAQTNQKIDALAISVTQAQSPKRTDWSVIIAASRIDFGVGGSGTYSSERSTQDNKQQIEKYHESMVEHMKLELHPVGKARIDALEKRYDQMLSDMIARDAALDAKLQRETALMTQLVSEKVTDLDIRLQREFNLVSERNAARLTKIEERNKNRDDLGPRSTIDQN